METIDEMKTCFSPLISFSYSSKTEKIDNALATAQGKISGAKKDSTNPHFKSSYADLASVYDACREALADSKIAHTQWIVASDDKMVHLVTRLSCEGQFYQSRSCIPVTKHDAQGYGSAVTYLRRYALMAAVGIAPDDDDGNAASKNPPPLAPPATKPKPATPTKGLGSGDRIYNEAPGTLNAQQKTMIELLAQEKGIDLIGYLSGRPLMSLSERTAADIYFELKAMK